MTKKRQKYWHMPYVCGAIAIALFGWALLYVSRVIETAMEFHCFQQVYNQYRTHPGQNLDENKRQRNVLLYQIHKQCGVDVEYEK